ncbi:MAG: methylenetetrahydrofolate reductase [Gammaproteobacteria bacterium]|nr:methylenetetrahydrofolate reductase [Gammaproteobacteria bacterium]
MRFDDEPIEPGDPLPILPGHHSAGRFERLLRAGVFTITAELSPPDSANAEDVYARARIFDGYVDGINATDGSGANCHMSSSGVCALLTRAGYAPVMQISCRDRNRIAIQGDVLGAAAMGVNNLLCLTGDGVAVGDHPGAKPVFDLDAIALLDIVRTMREQACFESGRALTTPPRVFLGSAANPFVPPQNFQVARLAKKARAGAEFVQTQYCFDVPLLERFMQQVRDEGLDKRLFILVGIGPLASARAAEWMRTHVPGVRIPDAVIDRLRRARGKGAAKAEGKRICIDILERVREIPGVCGVHLMAYRQEEAVAEIIDRSRALDGRIPWYPGRDHHSRPVGEVDSPTELPEEMLA